MEKQDEDMIRSLLDRDPELARYYNEHIEFERQLEAFNGKAYLSPDEEMERKRLQKLKLAGKDRIMAILHRYRSESSASH